ncbi:hypothetical protein XacyCFBP2565_21535 [Xanthomonas arboricola pv. corylina]|nr:hypothetical protein XacyCFBP2565_21535 [Xanthomonas arboricola pv. corylina]
MQVGGGNEGCFGFIAPRYHIKNELEWLFRETRVIDEPSERIAFFLFYFLHIHPFLDGNGRTSRLALQVLMREIGGGEVSLFFSAMAWLIKDIFVAKLFLARSYGPAFLVDFVFDVLFLKKDVEDLVLGARGDSCEAIISVRNFLLKKWASSGF